MKKLSMTTTAVLAVIISILATRSTYAFVVDWHSGIVGIVEGEQTARLNVVNVATADTRMPGVPCRVEMMFFDSDGEMLAMSMVTLDPGKAAFHDFTDSAYEEGRRLQIRVEVMAQGGGDCNIIPTLEVYDMDTMKTEVFVGNPND